MKIDLTKYYDVNEVVHWTTSIGVSMYDIELISKSTGEITTWSFTEEYFDELITEMEKQNKFLEEQIKILKSGNVFPMRRRG